MGCISVAPVVGIRLVLKSSLVHYLLLGVVVLAASFEGVSHDRVCLHTCRESASKTVLRIDWLFYISPYRLRRLRVL